MSILFLRRKRSYRKATDPVEAIALVVLGLILGTVFTFGQYYWDRPVTREEAVHVEAVFSGYRYPEAQRTKLHIGDRRYVVGRDSDIILEFSDHENLTIDESCVDDALLTQLQTLKAGDTVSCIVHPNSNTILEISVDNTLLLSFDATAARLLSDQRGFFVLGIIMYIAAIRGLLHLLPKKYR